MLINGSSKATVMASFSSGWS